jgi:hypothetical protein
MKQTAFALLISLCLTGGCRKPKPAQVIPPNPEPEAPVPAAAVKPSAPPVNIPLLETSVEFSDLNGLVAGYYEKHKRLPTIPELTKMYYKPIPVPPGYKLVIDPQSKQVKAVR